MSLTFQPFGDNAILISWPNEINSKTSQEIYLINQKIQGLVPDLIIETVTTYCSLTAFLKQGIDKIDLIKQLKILYQTHGNYEEIASKIWTIPVCYDRSLGIDLENLARLKNMTIENIIKCHSGAIYTVDFLGFLPGFPYLTGLNPVLNTPRLKTPRLSVAKGSVAIAGNQTGVYPISSPGGWNIIGRTAVTFFDPNKDQPCFIKPLDKIKFVPISLREFEND